MSFGDAEKLFVVDKKKANYTEIPNMDAADFIVEKLFFSWHDATNYNYPDWWIYVWNRNIVHS